MQVIHWSTSFSLNDLAFGHRVRSPAALLQHNLSCSEPAETGLNIYTASDIVCMQQVKRQRQRLAAAQAKMKKFIRSDS